MSENSNKGNTEQPPKDLLTDSAVLSKFIAKNAVVVDKTALIRDLFDSSDSSFFLARPRRFGKTLLLDTIQNIASGNRKLFANMEIGKDDSGYSWEKYPVIRLSFGGFPSEPNAFRQKLLNKLNKIASQHCLDIEPVQDITDIDDIIEAVSSKHHFSEESDGSPEMSEDRFNVVLLIDEYDFPLFCNLNNSSRLNKIQKLLYGFYSSLKNCENQLRLTFITGISKFFQPSIFSGLNSIVDISYNLDYSAICGFTEDEIKLYFPSHILLALSRMKKDGIFPDDSDANYFFERLKYWYDGYTWWNSDTTVYNPFSVVKCLKYKRFDYYWYNSGTSLAAYQFKHMAEIYFKILSNNLTFEETVGSVSDINVESEITRGREKGRVTSWQRPKQKQCSGANKCKSLRVPRARRMAAPSLEEGPPRTHRMATLIRRMAAPASALPQPD
ncbi:MAG: AAA family ATPase [Deltaproteobacteria bacterium]|nr:AAA family ATPase [Deltaproteobacteria bacterium]